MATSFKGMQPAVWQHPLDRSAMQALSAVSGLDALLRQVLGATTERALRLLHLSSTVRSSERQYPALHQCLGELCDLFGIESRPELYIAQSPIMNAAVLGVKCPFIVLNSALVDGLNAAELKAVLAHELAHIMSGHMSYKTLLWILVTVSVSMIPAADLLALPVLLALREWDRKSELSADRAAMLAVQDQAVMHSMLMKLAGGTNLANMDVQDFIQQAREYREGGGAADGLFKLINTLGRTHPFPVVRLAELDDWVVSGAYGRILGGDWTVEGQKDGGTGPGGPSGTGPSFGGDPDENQAPEKDPAARAAERIQEGLDQLRSKAEQAGNVISDKTRKLGDQLENFFKKL